MSKPSHAAHDNTTAAKKTIYDQEPLVAPLPTQTIDTSVPRIAAWTKCVRQEVVHLVNMTRAHGQMVVDRWIDTEKRIAHLVERTVPRGEKLAPGIIYIGVASLAGPIFTRRRNFAIRWTSPLVFASLASFYFLPGTSNVVMRNIWGRYGDPATIDMIRDKWREAKQAEHSFRLRVADSVQELRLSLQEGRGFSVNKSDRRSDND